MANLESFLCEFHDAKIGVMRNSLVEREEFNVALLTMSNVVDNVRHQVGIQAKQLPDLIKALINCHNALQGRPHDNGQDPEQPRPQVVTPPTVILGPPTRGPGSSGLVTVPGVTPIPSKLPHNKKHFSG